MASSFGYGQQTPYDGTAPLNEVIFIIRQMLARMNTMKVVKVLAVHNVGGVSVAGTVDVQPLVSQIDGNGNPQPHGTISGVQYFRLQGGAAAIICDPAVGDVGFLVCADRDGTRIKTGQSTTVDPGSSRRNDLQDGVYIGGIINATPTSYVSLNSDSSISIVDASGNKIVTSALGLTLSDSTGNQIQMRTGFVNIVTPVFQVNGVPVTIP